MNASVLVFLILVAVSSAAPKQSPAKTNDVAPADSNGYDQLEDFGYYKFSENESVWADAWRTCFEDDAHLLVIRSMEEFDAVDHWMQNYSDETPQLLNYGVHHRFQSGMFYTIFDEPIEEAGYNVWGDDFSDHVKYNNVDFPIVLIEIGYGYAVKGIFLQKYVGQPEHFICKREISTSLNKK